MGRLGILSLILATVLAGPLLAAPAPAPSPSPPPPAAPTHAPLEDVIARIKPAVVLIQVKSVFGGGAKGSGFIYAPSGYILTNQHVVDGATEITVTLPDRRTYPGTVVDYIRRNDYICPSGHVETWTDVAIVKINGTNLPTIPMGDSNTLRQGQEILVLGYPGGVSTEEVSVTRGIIGAVRSGWLQTDAVILPGNSGGPVVDRQGRVVGLSAFGTGQFYRIGGIVAINSVRAMAEAALRGGLKSQEFKITGVEYVPAVTVGRTRTWRRRYEPGNTRNQPGTQEYSSEVTQVQNFSGGFLYRVRTSLGTEALNWLDADGLWALASSGGGWTTFYPERGLLFSFPPCVGYSWRYGYRSEYQGQGIQRQATVDVRLEAANESVTVPAGSYSQVMKMVERTQGTDVRAGQQTAWRSIETTWWAPGVGVVRSTHEDPATGERLVEELVSTGAVVAAPPPPPPPAPPPTAAPTPAPQPAPPSAPPEAAAPSKPAAPNDQAIVPGERAGAARIGDQLDSVIKMVGEVPRVDRSQRPGQSSGWIDYEWPNHLYAVVDKETRIIMRAGVWAPNPEEVSRPPYRTAAGVEIGSPESAIFAAYGAPDINERGQRTQLYAYDRLGIGFYVPTQPGSVFLGRVYQIFVFRPGTFR